MVTVTSSRAPHWLELSLWVVGTALIGFYVSARAWSEHARREAIRSFDQQHAVTQAGSRGAGTPAVQVDQSLWSHSRTVAYASTRLAAGAPEAILRIPSLALEVPVFTGASELNLNRGAARVAGTARFLEGGNVGIAGHRDGFFRKLKDVSIGTEVDVDTGGTTLRYSVVDLRIVPASDNSVLGPTRIPSVTLVTCYPFYYVGPAPRRYIIRAEMLPERRSLSTNLSHEPFHKE